MTFAIDPNLSSLMSILIVSISMLTSYLCGSLSTAIMTCNIMGLPDPRTLGSCNPGATNVLRIGNKTAAIITLLGDAVKALVPLLLVIYVLKYYGINYALVAALTGLSAFIGHLFPVFFNFKGGKGVATAFGMLLGLSPLVFVATGISWLLMAVMFRYSALAALTAFALAPLYIWLVNHRLDWTLVIALMSLLIYWRHRSNIRDLLNGQEDKIGHKN